MTDDPRIQPNWREMDDDQRSLAYSPSSALAGDIGPLIQRYVDQSAAAYAALKDVQTISYGTKASQTFDLVVPDAEKPVPLLVFFHGGYWQELSKRESFGAALDAIAQGVAFAAIDYSLAPHATIDEIVAESCEALMAIIAKAPALGVDPARIVVSGSSAGAHLAAMACLDLPSWSRPRGAVLLSGIYELEPLVGTYINEALAMERTTAARNSPALKDLSGFPPTLIAWGAQETDEFKKQSQWFADKLRQAGTSVETFEIPRRNHFDIIEDLANPSELGCGVMALLKQ